MGNSISVSFSTNLQDSKSWLKLEQKIPSSLLRHVTAYKLYKMYTLARSGFSAQRREVLDCNSISVGFQGSYVSVVTSFYIWSSSISANYESSFQFTENIEEFAEDLNISRSFNFGDSRIVHKQKAFSMIVSNTNYIDLPWYFENCTVVFETPCFDSSGSPIHEVTYSLEYNTRIKFSKSFFGVVRISGTIKGYEQDLEIRVDKGLSYVGAQETYTPYDLKDFEGSINVKQGKLSASFVLMSSAFPECLERILNLCLTEFHGGSGQLILLDLFNRSSMTMEEDHLTVYYNVCTGKKIRTDKNRDPSCG